MPRNIMKKGVDFQDFTDPSENYLGYDDFKFRGVTEAVFTIVSLDVDNIPRPQSSKVDQKVVATLKGQEKGLIISPGKRKKLTSLFGPFQNWIGKQIKLVADPNRKWRGQVVGGLEIRGVDQ